MKKMRLYHLLILTSLIISACSQNSGSGSNDKSEKQFRDQVISIAEEYVAGQLKDAKKVTDKNGIITMGDEQKRFIIDPSELFTGLIDSDKYKDAMISVFPFEGHYEVMTHHLIMIENDGELRLSVVKESDMRIITIKDGIITADVPEHSRNNPLFNCASCWDVVKYKFKDGDLVELK